jgi:hypothetical protein
MDPADRHQKSAELHERAAARHDEAAERWERSGDVRRADLERRNA